MVRLIFTLSIALFISAAIALGLTGRFFQGDGPQGIQLGEEVPRPTKPVYARLDSELNRLVSIARLT